MRQSAKPKGPNSGAMSPAMRARMLACGSAVNRSCRSKFCKNQVTMVAAKMTVKAFCKKVPSLFPQQLCHVFQAGQAVVGQLHDKGHRLALNTVLLSSSAASTPTAMPVKYSSTITRPAYCGKNAAANRL